MDGKPPLSELLEHVDVLDWKQVGILLGINPKRLDVIDREGKNEADKLTKMYQAWLDTQPNATRRQLIEVLKKSVIGQNTIAENYEKWIAGNTATARCKPGTDSATASHDGAADITWNITQLNDVLTYLRRRDFGNAKWRDLGLNLGVTVNSLDTIEADHSGAGRRLQECLAKWLRQGNATKSVLDKAIDIVLKAD